MRLDMRGLNRARILKALAGSEIIEEYPTAKPFPSYLLLSHDEDGYALHYNIAVDRQNSGIRMVTVYYPDPQKWDSTFRLRRDKK